MNATTLDEDALQLCYAIEKAGASEQLTKCSVMAAALRKRINDTKGEVGGEVGISASEERDELQATLTSCEAEVAKVYCEITGGRFSKINTRAEVILDCVERRYQEKEVTAAELVKWVRSGSEPGREDVANGLNLLIEKFLQEKGAGE